MQENAIPETRGLITQAMYRYIAMMLSGAEENAVGLDASAL
jgi:hypothetical protein